MDNLDEYQSGWFHRTAALSSLADVRDFRRRQTMLLVSANACLQQGLPYAALAFEAATLENAHQWNQAVPIAEAYLHRAETQQKLGDRKPKPWSTSQRRRHGSRNLAPIPLRRAFPQVCSSLPERFNNRRSRPPRLRR